ncbi:hypothetical protein EPN81_03365 [Patescibacteria group bacterium]|nr:MAG: hypothetical protein EPN81_03365 [Patescibacteria group bacterium]
MRLSSSQRESEPSLDQLSRWKRAREKHGLKFEITADRDEAEEVVAELLESGEKPLITVPEQYIEYIKTHGISPTHKLDQTGRGKHYSVLAGRLGAEPYFNLNEERWVVEIDPKGLHIQPRFTGADHAFYGTITIEGTVPPDSIHVIGKFTSVRWQEYVKEKHQRDKAA